MSVTHDQLNGDLGDVYLISPLSANDLRRGPDELGVDLRVGYGIEELCEEVAGLKEGWFTYGGPVQWEQLGFPNKVGYDPGGTILRDKMFDFQWNVKGYVDDDDALTAVHEVHRLTSSPNDGRVTLFEKSALDWDHDPGIETFMEELYVLLGVNELVRDDTVATHGVGLKYGTKIHVAFSGGLPLLLVERSRINEDDMLVRTVELIKTFDPELLLGVANEFSLAEELRLTHLLESWKITDEQRAHLATIIIDRSIGGDSRAVRDGHIKRVVEQALGTTSRVRLWRGWAVGEALLPRLTGRGSLDEEEQAEVT